MAEPRHLTMGPYWVDLLCPECRLPVTVAAKLSTRLTVTSDEPAQLRLVVATAKAEHLCGQLQLALVPDDA